MSFAHPLTFLRRVIAVPALLSSMLALSVPFAWGASSPVKITIHIPGKSLAVLVFYFCKDKGFLFRGGNRRAAGGDVTAGSHCCYGGRRIGLLHNTGSSNRGDYAGSFA